jgi:methionyl-tRNA synthetase
MSKTLVTTPIFYPNASLHIGHATTLVTADIRCALLSLMGNKSILLTGLDEHGQKVFHAAQKNKLDVHEYLEQQFEQLQILCRKLNIRVDIWSRTTAPIHVHAVQKIWSALYAEGYIYTGKYAGYYSEKDESFYAQTDLLLKDGQWFTQDGGPVEYISEDCYYLKLDKRVILNLIEQMNIYPSNRKKELYCMVNDDKLSDLCISRRGGWGIPIPNGSGIIYVWLDALSNYMTHGHEFSQMINVIGKDILKFHGIYWPYIVHIVNKCWNKIQLPGISSVPLPSLSVHNWWLSDDRKMSKSFNNIISPVQLIEKYGTIAVRFFLAAAKLKSSDQTFNEHDIVTTYNTFVVGKFANLVYRTWCLAYKHQSSFPGPIVKKDNVYTLSLSRFVAEDNLSELIDELFLICHHLNKQFEDESRNNPEVIYEVCCILKGIIEYFVCILGDDTLKLINFLHQPHHIYERLMVE